MSNVLSSSTESNNAAASNKIGQDEVRKAGWLERSDSSIPLTTISARRVATIQQYKSRGVFQPTTLSPLELQ